MVVDTQTVKEVNVLQGWHVTDNPERVLAVFRSGRDISQTRDLGLYGDLQTSGLYFSDAPQLWTGRAISKWDFLKTLTELQRIELGRKLELELRVQRVSGYITQSELEIALRDIHNFEKTGFSDALIMIADQPYNLKFWKPEYLSSLGIEQQKPPIVVPVEARGRFADLTNHRITPEFVDSLKAAGFDGAFVRPSFSNIPQMVVWNTAAVVRFGEWQKGQAISNPSGGCFDFANAKTGYPTKFTAYHGTSEKAAALIIKKGFQLGVANLLGLPDFGPLAEAGGVFVSPSRYQASKFAKKAAGTWTDSKGQILKVEVELINPYVIEKANLEMLRNLPSVAELKAQGYDGIIVKQWKSFTSSEPQAMIFDIGKIKLYGRETVGNPMTPEEFQRAKYPWQMTKDWHRVLAQPDTFATGGRKWIIRSYVPAVRFTTYEAAERWLDEEHKRQVKQALIEGKRVSSEVLKDYPELKANNPPPLTKEIWKMTRDELIKHSLINALGRQRTLNMSIVKGWHHIAVLKALREGKPVPAEVLKDYPELMRRKNPEFSEQIAHKQIASFLKRYGIVLLKTRVTYPYIKYEDETPMIIASIPESGFNELLGKTIKMTELPGLPLKYVVQYTDRKRHGYFVYPEGVPPAQAKYFEFIAIKKNPEENPSDRECFKKYVKEFALFVYTVDYNLQQLEANGGYQYTKNMRAIFREILGHYWLKKRFNISVSGDVEKAIKRFIRTGETADLRAAAKLIRVELKRLKEIDKKSRMALKFTSLV